MGAKDGRRNRANIGECIGLSREREGGECMIKREDHLYKLEEAMLPLHASW